MQNFQRGHHPCLKLMCCLKFHVERIVSKTFNPVQAVEFGQNSGKFLRDYQFSSVSYVLLVMVSFILASSMSP